MPSCTLRPATPDDRDFLYRTKSDGLRGYAEAIWGPWDEPAQRARFDDGFDHQRFRLVLVDAQPIGFVESSEEEDHVRLRNIALVEGWRGRGIGTSLLLGLADETDKPVRLRVLKGSSAVRVRANVHYSLPPYVEMPSLTGRVHCCSDPLCVLNRLLGDCSLRGARAHRALHRALHDLGAFQLVDGQRAPIELGRSWLDRPWPELPRHRVLLWHIGRAVLVPVLVLVAPFAFIYGLVRQQPASLL